MSKLNDLNMTFEIKVQDRSNLEQEYVDLEQLRIPAAKISSLKEKIKYSMRFYKEDIKKG